jgi:hypothetical protein
MIVDEFDSDPGDAAVGTTSQKAAAAPTGA